MRQAATAIAAYHEIEPTLAARQQFVRELLAGFHLRHHDWPTANELLRYAVTSFPAAASFDVNSIRPRLFELEVQGYVQHGPKRACGITGKTVWTWIASTPQPQLALRW